jgi:hypothetical protein
VRLTPRAGSTPAFGTIRRRPAPVAGAKDTGKVVSVEGQSGLTSWTIDYGVAVPVNLTLDLGAMLQGLAAGLGGIPKMNVVRSPWI